MPETDARPTLGISHLAIKVRDLRVAERFYCDVLGLQVERRWPDAGSAAARDRSLWLRTGDDAGTFLALERVTPGEARRDAAAARSADTEEEGGHHLLALRIARGARQAFEARLLRAGVAITHRTAFTIYFRDPEGNRLGLSHHPDAAPALPPGQEPGPAPGDDG